MSFAFRPTYRRQVALNRPTYLVDGIDNVYAAAGTRLLVRGYSGPLIRVRRDSDNAEQDFGPQARAAFSPVNSGDVSAFLGGTGDVTTIYDQFGNGRNVVQATAANQPEIDLSGAFPVVKFVAASSHFMSFASSLAFAQNVAEASIMGVFRNTDAVAANKDTFIVYTNTTGDYRLGLRIQALTGRVQSLTKTTDGSSTRFLNEQAAGDLGWRRVIARAAFSAGMTYVNAEGEAESSNTLTTPSNTSNTASVAGPTLFAWQATTGFSSGQLSAALLFSDLLTTAESRALINRAAALKP